MTTTHTTTSTSPSTTTTSSASASFLDMTDFHANLEKDQQWIQGLYKYPSDFGISEFVDQFYHYQQEARPRRTLHPHSTTTLAGGGGTTTSTLEYFPFSTHDLLAHPLVYFLHTQETMFTDAMELEVTSYIPYRDSKLTRVLQPSLSGNARISVICTLSSSLHHLDESLSTLQFATRVKRIVVQPQPKSLSEHGLLQKYKEEIEQLKSKVIEMNHHFEKERELEERTRALEKEKFTEVISQHQMIRNTLKQRIDHLSRLILLSGQNNVELPPTPPTSPSSDNPAIPFDPTPTVQHLQQTILHQHQKLKELEIVIKDLEDQKEQLKKNHLEELQGWKDQVLSSTSPRPSTSTSLHEDKSTSISSDFPLLFQDTDPMNMVQPLTFHSHEVQTDGSGVEDPVIPPFVQETHPIIDPMPSLPVRLNMTESKDAWTAMSIEEIPLTSSKSTQVMEEPPLTQEEKETHPSESTPPSVPSFSTPSTQEDLNSTFVKDLNITTATLALPLSQESNLRSSSNEPSSSVEMTLDECKTQLTLLQQRLDEERTEQVSIVEALQKQIQWMHEDTKYWKNMADACTLQVEHMDEQMLTQATLHQGTYQQLETIQTQLKHLIHQNKALQSQYQEQMESLQTELDLTRMEVNLLNLMRSTPTFHFYKPVKDPLDPLDGK
ncbi:hypothetical protein HMI54_004327 [Coelomomyces lativittatus]|nr:hypothetical protein HMI54_004327 [Coelomomyces lativittatus]